MTEVNKQTLESFSQAERGDVVDGDEFFNQIKEERSNTMTEQTQNVDGVAGERLKSYIDRIERLNAEKQAIADDTKDVYAEAKGMGFDVKALRKVIALRKIDRDTRAEQEAILETYMTAIGEK